MPRESGKPGDSKRPPALYRRPTPARDRQASRMIAWDLETTRIGPGTPAPVYITGYGENPSFIISKRVDSVAHLLEILRERFLISDFYGCKFVAWNANNFDSYFVAAALLQTEDFVMRPYLTRGKTLRGMKVFRKGCVDDKGKEYWEFLDGIAMTGLQGTSLAKFTEKFSPDRQKQSGVIDFESGEEFDADNLAHCEYALEDSVSLYYAMVAAESIMLQRWNAKFGATMGGACIKIFKANIPEGKVIYDAGEKADDIIRQQVMRGGYCFCARRYEGKIWKYDINQAYAAAMREAKLPAGNCYAYEGVHPVATVFIALVEGRNPDNKVPFYCKISDKGRFTAVFAEHDLALTWITSIELRQLQSEGWDLKIHRTFFWDDEFTMKTFVDSLEHARANAAGGSNGAEGTMIKAVGNHSYGKTVESLDPKELVLSLKCPDGFTEYQGREKDALFQHVWERKKEDERGRDYHKPHIGAFITAHVRMVVRRAALLDPDNWLYTDTDCVVFSADVTDKLDIHAKRYGAWKIEASGEPYRIITKKVYAQMDFDPSPKNKNAVRHAKGLNVKYLTPQDFETWYLGTAPVQSQIHRNNFVKVMHGKEMYVQRDRKGTAVALPVDKPKKRAQNRRSRNSA